jgi:hypothetical protein
MKEPLATFDHAAGGLAESLAFLKRTWAELRELRKVYVWKDRLRVTDVNGDSFEVRGVGYADADVIPLLRLVNAAYDPDSIHLPPPNGCRELGAGRRHAWAQDRAM